MVGFQFWFGEPSAIGKVGHDTSLPCIFPLRTQCSHFDPRQCCSRVLLLYGDHRKPRLLCTDPCLGSLADCIGNAGLLGHTQSRCKEIISRSPLLSWLATILLKKTGSHPVPNAWNQTVNWGFSLPPKMRQMLIS